MRFMKCVLVLVALLCFSLSSFHASVEGSADQLVWSFGTGGTIVDLSVLADVDGDGVQDVLASSQDNNLYLLSGASGKRIWNFLGPAATVGAVAVKDFTGDGKDDVVVGFENGVIYGLNVATGRPLYRVELGVRLHKITAFDGVRVLILTENYIGLVEVPRGLVFKSDVGWEVKQVATVPDITGDGKPDVAFSAYYYDRYGEYIKFRLYNGADLQLIAENTYRIYESLKAIVLLLVPDISGDNYPDIVLGGSTYAFPDKSFLAVFSGATGKLIYTVVREGRFNYALGYALGISDRATILIGVGADLVAIDGSRGNTIWTASLGGGGVTSIARVPKSLESSADDIVVGTENLVARIDGKTGTIRWTYPIRGGCQLALIPSKSPGGFDIIIGSADRFVYRLAGLLKYSAKLTLSASALTLKEGESVVAEGLLVCEGPQDLARITASNAEIRVLVMRPDTTNETKVVKTNDKGYYSFAIKADVPGNWTVKASWAGDENYEPATATLTISVLSTTEVVGIMDELKQLRSSLTELSARVSSLMDELKQLRSSLTELSARVSSLERERSSVWVRSDVAVVLASAMIITSTAIAVSIVRRSKHR
jgi:outer membrane protein assembly factor BamB